MKKFIATIGLLSLAGTASAADLTKKCWDGTFFYNTVTVEESSLGVEVSVRGGGLKLPPLSVDYSKSIVSGDFGYERLTTHLLFPANSKVVNADGTITLKAGTVVTEVPDNFPIIERPTLWLETSFTSLGEVKPLILDIELKSAELTIAQDKVDIAFTQYTSDVKGKISVECRIEGSQLAFPEQLKKHLEAAKAKNAKS